MTLKAIQLTMYILLIVALMSICNISYSNDIAIDEIYDSLEKSKNKKEELRKAQSVNRQLIKLADEYNVKLMLTPMVLRDLSVDNVDVAAKFSQRYTINEWGVLYSDSEDIDKIVERYNNNYKVWQSVYGEVAFDSKSKLSINGLKLDLFLLVDIIKSYCGSLVFKNNSKTYITTIDSIGSKGVCVCEDFMLLLSVNGKLVTNERDEIVIKEDTYN